MVARDRKTATGKGQGAGDELPELAVTDHQNPVLLSDPYLLPNLQGGCQGLGEDRGRGVQCVRDLVQVSRGEHEVLGEGAIAACDPENSAIAAVGPHAGPAAAAGSAGGVNLANHSFTGERSGLYDPDELVAQYAAEGVVPSDQLDVGVADTGDENPDQTLSRCRFRARQIASQGELSLLEPQTDHGSFTRVRGRRGESEISR